jgi:hypothetical protein
VRNHVDDKNFPLFSEIFIGINIFFDPFLLDLTLNFGVVFLKAVSKTFSKFLFSIFLLFAQNKKSFLNSFSIKCFFPFFIKYFENKSYLQRNCFLGNCIISFFFIKKVMCKFCE